MNIIQTLWTNGRSLSDQNFGWLTPQHHLMGWTLSCLKIREFYDDLYLYTDSQGEEILSSKLKLPYTKINNVYSDLRSTPFWAVSKVLTYSKQVKPFVHIDGDVFIWERFSNEIETAEIVAQNREIGTKYYGDMMKTLLCELNYLPDNVRNEINRKSISSYNAGILGGHDILFLKSYTQKALELVERNLFHLSNSASFNILFEQVLFYILVSEAKKKVTCQLKESYKDNGYTINDFGDFTRTKTDRTFLHLIGPHKNNKKVCDLMARTLLAEYPYYYYNVINLFKATHIHYFGKQHANMASKLGKRSLFCKRLTYFGRTIEYVKMFEGSNEAQELSISRLGDYIQRSNCIELKSLFRYENDVYKLVRKWSRLNKQTLLELERHPAYAVPLLSMPVTEYRSVVLKRNPYLSILVTSHDWPMLKLPIIGYREVERLESRSRIACIPELFFNGYSELTIDDLDYNILMILGDSTSLLELVEKIVDCFPNDGEENSIEIIYKLVLIKAKNLINHKVIYINNKI